MPSCLHVASVFACACAAAVFQGIVGFQILLGFSMLGVALGTCSPKYTYDRGGFSLGMDDDDDDDRDGNANQDPHRSSVDDLNRKIDNMTMDEIDELLLKSRPGFKSSQRSGGSRSRSGRAAVRDYVMDLTACGSSPVHRPGAAQLHAAMTTGSFGMNLTKKQAKVGTKTLSLAVS